MVYSSSHHLRCDALFQKNLAALKNLLPTCAQAKGSILGVGAKLFGAEGSVSLQDVSAAVVYGFIYWIPALF